MTVPNPQIVEADSPERIAFARALINEYIASLGVDLSFQDVSRELAELEQRYAPPRGCLLVALNGAHPVGCVAVHPLDAVACEMKRLYVRPEIRGTGLGRRLAERAIAFARRSGYSAMRLDTMPSMVVARQLYAGLGFQEIPPYRSNATVCTKFLELQLQT